MFSPRLQSPTKSIKSHLCTHSNSLLLFTHTPQQQQQQTQLEQPITNTSYWTKTIHNLCTTNNNINLDKAINLLNTLYTHGYQPNPLNLATIIHALCKSNRFAEAHTRFLWFLSHIIIPDERTCNVIIARLLGWGKRPDVTLRVVNRVIELKPWFVPSVVNFNRLIDGFCSGLFVRFGHMLLFRMRGMGQSPNVVTYSTLIKGYCAIGEVGLARKVFDEMSEWGVKANAVTYSLLISGVIRNKGAGFESSSLGEELWKLRKSMDEEEDVRVNHAAFTNLINSFCQEGLFKSVFDIAEKMPDWKNVNDGFAYAQMIDSLCRYGRYHGASRIVYIMMRRGCVPSFVSYNSIIHGLTKNGGYLRAYQLLEQGIVTGYTPSETTYKILMERLCVEEYDLVKAKKLLDIMLSKEGVDKARIYNIYLRALCQIKNDVSTELLNTLVTMLETRCHPDVVTLNTVINGFCKMGKVDDGLKVLDDMVMKKFNFCTPDSVTFTTIISGLLSVGRTNEALDILCKLMPVKGFHRNVITYNVVLRGLFKLNLANEAMDVFKSMVDGGVDADCTTHAIMIGGLCECNRVDGAKVFWDDVIWPSKVHDGFVYSAMVKGLCCAGKFDEACDFAYELVDCGVKLNVVNYNILIEGACKLGLKKDAYQIVGEMRRNGIAPDAVTWRIIDKLHKQKKGTQTVKSDYSDDHLQNTHINPPLMAS